MSWLNFKAYPILLNLVIFAVAAGLVWYAGSHISRYTLELSTAIAAVRLGNYSMAVSNIFGSNGIMVALLLFADLFHGEGPLLLTGDAGSTFTVAMGIVVTGAFLVGMVERRNQVFLRMDIDSIYSCGLFGISWGAAAYL